MEESSKLHQGNPFLCMKQETLQEILQYLLPHDLNEIESVSKSMNNAVDVLDGAWEWIVRRRWNSQALSKKNLSVTRWKQAYQLLASRNQIPEGKHSGKLQNIFAQGFRSRLASSWIMINHGNNAILRSSVLNRSQWNLVEVRLCLQNLFETIISISLNSSAVKILAFHSDEVNGDELLTSNFRCLAINGQLQPPIDPTKPRQSSVVLNPLDFTVISFSVYCPTSIESEPDFLTMIDKFFVQVETLHTQHSMSLAMISHTIIWNMYTTLPSGVVLLKERPMVSAV
jgi:hypothetical protein